MNSMNSTNALNQKKLNKIPAITSKMKHECAHHIHHQRSLSLSQLVVFLYEYLLLMN